MPISENACPGADDPEERCPKHPSECTCWTVDGDHTLSASPSDAERHERAVTEEMVTAVYRIINESWWGESWGADVPKGLAKKVLDAVMSLRSSSVSCNTTIATVSDHNAAFDPADDAFGGAFKDGFREGWLFAKSPDFEDRDEFEKDYSHVVDMAPTECWDAYRERYFAMLPLAAIPEVGATLAPPPPIAGQDDCFSKVVSFFVQHGMLDEHTDYDLNDIMVALRDNYEPEPAPTTNDPIGVITAMMAERGLSNPDLYDVFGGKNRTSEILRRKRVLALPHIRRLHERFGLSLEALIGSYRLAPPSTRDNIDV